MSRWKFDLASLELSPLHAIDGSMKLLRDPTDDSLWLFDHERDPELLHRKNGKWQPVVEGSASFALPDPYSTLYRNFVSVWFDEGPCYVAVHYSEMYMARFDGKRFVRLPAPMQAANCDGFVFDPKRKRLCHFISASTRDVREDEARTRRYGKGIAVRELGPDGWIDRDERCTSLDGDLHAAWDDARKAAIVIAADGRTAAWNGERWSTAGKLPFSLQNRPEMAVDGEGRLVLAHVAKLSCGSGRYTENTGQLAQLGGRGWKALDANGFRELHGGAFDPKAGTAVFFAPLFAPGVCFPQFAAVREGSLQPHGAWFPPMEHVVAVSSDQALHQGLTLEGLDRSTPDGEREAEKTQLALVDARGVTPLAPAQGALQELVATPRGPMTVGWRGEVFVFENGAIQKIADAPPGWQPRRSSALAWARDGLMVVGGTRLAATVEIRETWKWDGRWSLIKAKGKEPVVYQASAAFDETRGVLVMTGGKMRYKPTGLTSEWDGKRWSHHPTKLELGHLHWNGSHVIGFDYSSVYVYQGAGRWKKLGDIEPDENGVRAGGRMAFDRDRLFGFGSWRSRLYGRAEASIADLLGRADSLRAPKPEAPIVVVQSTRHLKFEDGQSKKFWFGSVEKSSLLVRWGRRGTQGQSKRLKLKSPDAAQKELAKRAQSKIDEGYLDAPEGEAAAKIPGKHTWVMSYKKGKGADRVGGMPPRGSWPICKDCKTPMIFVMLLHKNDEWLPLPKSQALAVFTCNGKYSGGTCETWDSGSGCNAVLFIDDPKALAKDVPSGPKGPPDELEPRAIRYEKVFEPDTSIEEDEEAVNYDKAGGFPGWIQGDQIPKCKRCKKPMRFVAQFDEIGELNFGGGRAYVFVCDDEHDARFLWQQ